MDYDPSKYEINANDVQQPAQYLVQLIDRQLKKRNDSKNNDHIIILDLGCGPGNTAEMLAKHFPNATILGVDIDPEMIEFAQKKHLFRTQFFVQDIELPWSNWSEDLRKFKDRIDVIFSNYTLHWLEDTDALAETIRHLLRSGGFFTGNLLYCGWLQSVSENNEEKSLLDNMISYPTEKEFVSRFFWSLRSKGDFHWINFEYQEPISRYSRKFYSESFIEIPLKWYRKYLNKSKPMNDKEYYKLNEIIKRLILKQRICKVIPGVNQDYPDEEIDIKQQLYIFQTIKK